METDLTAETQVTTLARDLGTAIADLDAYQRLKAAEQAVKDSDEAQAMIDEFEQQREELMLARQIGEAAQADMAELRSMQAELHELPVMQEYLEAQRALDQHLDSINRTISEQLTIDFADAAGSCCHD